MSLLQSLHDAWCTITGKCPTPPPPDDEYVKWLKNQERASRDAVEHNRQNSNRLEELMLNSRLPNQRKAGQQ